MYNHDTTYNAPLHSPGLKFAERTSFTARVRRYIVLTLVAISTLIRDRHLQILKSASGTRNARGGRIWSKHSWGTPLALYAAIVNSFSHATNNLSEFSLRVPSRVAFQIRYPIHARERLAVIPVISDTIRFAVRTRAPPGLSSHRPVFSITSGPIYWRLLPHIWTVTNYPQIVSPDRTTSAGHVFRGVNVLECSLSTNSARGRRPDEFVAFWAEQAICKRHMFRGVGRKIVDVSSSRTRLAFNCSFRVRV